MLFKVKHLIGAALIVSAFVQMHMAKSGYAAPLAKIAFSSVRDDNSDIYVMDSDGGNQVRLTIDPARDYDPSWSPDGERIAFNRNGHIYVMDSDKRNLMRLTKNETASEPAWSPDGAKIAFTRFKALQQQVWVMDTDGQNPTLLTHVGANSNPAWAPDGVRIAFSSTRDGEADIYLMEENGNNQERLTYDRGLQDRPSWSPDGQWIAYDSFAGSGVYEIYVVTTDGNGLTRRLAHDLPHKFSPAWSPDGQTIAYVSSTDLIRESRQQIHLMTADGDYLKRLSKPLNNDTDPDWYAPVGWSVSPATSYLTIWGEIKASTANRR